MSTLTSPPVLTPPRVPGPVSVLAGLARIILGVSSGHRPESRKPADVSLQRPSVEATLAPVPSTAAPLSRDESWLKMQDEATYLDGHGREYRSFGYGSGPAWRP